MALKLFVVLFRRALFLVFVFISAFQRDNYQLIFEALISDIMDGPLSFS